MLLTRLELMLRIADLKPAAFARGLAFARPHIASVRHGANEPARKFIVDATKAYRRLTGKRVAPEDLFERADALLRGTKTRLKAVHATDLARLEEALIGLRTGAAAETIIATGVASETCVRCLLREAAYELDRTPALAARIFEAAMLMCERLTASPPQLAAALAGYATKGYANALRHLGRFDEALDTLVGAAAYFKDAQYCDDEVGQVEHTRALVLFKMERWRESRHATREARRYFIRTRNARRVARTDLLEAAICYEEGDLVRAREIWSQLRTRFAAMREREWLARTWLNLGAVHVRLRSEGAARHCLNRASAAFRALNLRTEVIRVRWWRLPISRRLRAARPGCGCSTVYEATSSRFRC